MTVKPIPTNICYDQEAFLAEGAPAVKVSFVRTATPLAVVLQHLYDQLNGVCSLCRLCPLGALGALGVNDVRPMHEQDPYSSV